MLRSVQRALRASGGGAPPEPFSPSANSTTVNNATANSRKAAQFNNKPQPTPPNTALNLSSSSGGPSANFSTLINLPKSGAPGAAATAWGSCSDDDDAEWERVDVNHELLDDQRAVVFSEDFVFRTVPSSDEVNYAISALQHAITDVENEDNKTEVFEKIISSSSESEADWIEPSLNIRSSRMLQPYGSDRVYDAFHLLQSEPSVQRMVFALSSDKAVWDAVLNNDVVKELRGSFSQAGEQGDSTDDEASDDDNNPVKDVMSWVFVNVKAKIMQLIDKITELANEIFQSGEKKGGKIDPLQEKLKTSLFLSIIVLLIVVVTRAKSA
ncbi:hypothetical protein PHJA_002651100 [Phtheirospermum japonicum]|uniref:Uncharacterized protein n=1 Tax=Phtheirospermum japonicum TaxID=374723 RepID=A0A830D1B3_9LAMI|nr:hypothetical protein PHJA_002651100 [Phtheirospermum japonicum]